jgi:hypothetical protein
VNCQDRAQFVNLFLCVHLFVRITDDQTVVDGKEGLMEDNSPFVLVTKENKASIPTDTWKANKITDVLIPR